MKTAIICYSFTQNNLMLAGELLTRTGGTIIPIEEITARNRLTIFLDLFFRRVPRIREYLHLDERFDHYILVAPVWGGKIASPMKAFLLKEGPKIKSYSFISLCGGGKDQTAGIERELTDIVKRKPIAVSQLSLTELCNDRETDLINYKVERADLRFFEEKIDNFLFAVTKASAPVVTV